MIDINNSNELTLVIKSHLYCDENTSVNKWSISNFYLNTQANKAPNPKPKKAIRKPAATIKAVIKAKQVQYAYIPT